MERKNLSSFFDRAFIVVFILMFFVSINYLTLSPLSIGLALPTNAAVWLSIAVIILLSVIKVLLTDTIRISKLLIPLFLTFLLMLLPGLIKTESDSTDVLLRVSQLIGFFLLFFSFSQYRFTQRKINLFFYLIVFSALVQIIYALAQLFHNPETTPDFLLFYLGINRPPVGGIAQINALSIYLVTTMVISFYLFLQPSFKTQGVLKKLSLLIVVLGGSYLVSINSSRGALIALSIAIPLILLSRWNEFNNKKFFGGMLLLSLIVGLSIGFQFGGDRILHKTTNSRSLAWNISYQIIKEKPLLGYGLGGFTKAFFDKSEKDNRKIQAFFTHPHNEILYWWVESGALAVIAILTFFTLYMKLLLKHRWRYVLQYIALLLPLSFHTQVSLPFYLSTILMVLFVFLLVLPLRNLSKEYQLTISDIYKKVIIVFSLIFFFTYFVFIKETIQGGKAFVIRTSTGENDYKLIEKELGNPYWGKLASVYIHIALLRQELAQDNTDKARIHLSWLEEYVKRNESPMYYQVLLAAYNLMNEESKSSILKERLKNRYPSYFKD